MSLVSWKYPSMDWIKLNVDGCSKGNLRCAGAGGLIRDSLGSLIKGFPINTGPIYSLVIAELWAVVKELELA